jgi:hypothetical protein
MNLYKRYRKKKKIREMVYSEFKKSLKDGDFIRSSILSKRFLKIK